MLTKTIRQMLIPDILKAVYNPSKPLIDPLLIEAIIEQESNGYPMAIRFEPDWYSRCLNQKLTKTPGLHFIDAAQNARQSKITEPTEEVLQSCSFGLMQIMGGKARELGYVGPLLTLIEPAANIDLGCRILTELKKRYWNTADIIAAYNAGEPNKTKSGRYVNQKYVDSVFDKYFALRRATGTDAHSPEDASGNPDNQQ